MSALVTLFPGLADMLILSGVCGVGGLLYLIAVLLKSLK